MVTKDGEMATWTQVMVLARWNKDGGLLVIGGAVYLQVPTRTVVATEQGRCAFRIPRRAQKAICVLIIGNGSKLGISMRLCRESLVKATTAITLGRFTAWSGCSASPAQSNGQNFIYVFHWNEFEFLLRFLGNVDQVFFVELGNDDSGNAGAHCSQTFFFQSADRQNESAQSNLARHRDIGTTGLLLEKRSERSKHGDAS